MIPVTVNLTQARGSNRTFNFEVVNDQMFTPLMTYAALLNTLSSYERQYGAATFSVRGQAMVKGHEAIAFDDLFSTGQSAMDASAYIVAPLTYLLGNDYEKVEVSGLDLTIGSTEEPRTATLERAWIDDPRPRAGRTVPLKILLRTYRGEDEVRTLPVQIPANASGTLSVMVTDGSRLNQMEMREARTPPQLRSVDQVIKSLNKARRNNTLYVRLLGTDAGAVVERRGAVLASAVGAGRARSRPQRRHFQPGAQRDHRRMGARDRARRQRLAHAVAHPLLELDREIDQPYLWWLLARSSARCSLASLHASRRNSSRPKHRPIFSAATSKTSRST